MLSPWEREYYIIQSNDYVFENTEVDVFLEINRGT
jgi:hypothetical protein